MPRKGSAIFRIFAIKPLAGCKPEILKILKAETIYYLHSDFQVDKNGDLHYQKSYPEHLYDTFNLRLSLSAIAGKNGSGKSTLIEVLLMAINNIGCHIGIKNDLQTVNGLKVDLFVQIGTCFRITIIENAITIRAFDESGKLSQEEKSALNRDDLRNLFYTICMNYSHYAYNFRDYRRENQNDWLSPLFHKNDAYQTPLVINPWRDNGDIIIDRENSLINFRLVANLLRPSDDETYSFRDLTENLRAVSLILSEDRSKVYDSELYQRAVKNTDKTSSRVARIAFRDLKSLKKDDIWGWINKEFDFGYENLKLKPDKLEQMAMDYLIRKLISVAIKYEEYHGYFITEEDDFDYKKLRGYIKRLVRDRSHIGFKFRQTLNYLRYKHIKLNPEDLTLDALSATIGGIIDRKASYKDQIIELVPPPIFKVDILLSPKVVQDNVPVTLKSLSSGEKQMIYSLSSVLYHLSNLDSVSAKSKTKVKYRRVQIIMEEIELYFHPEMQRTYIRFLRESIFRLELQSIWEISICFVTHSPFILSDIPNSCILFLQVKDGKAQQVNKFRKTFAANIHDLLSDVFFMEEGVCGAFAINQINKTVAYLNHVLERNEVAVKLVYDPKNEKLLERLNDLENEISGQRQEDHALLIENIGEPVIQTKLEEMYDEAFPVGREARIRAEIERLQKLLNPI